MDDRPVNIIKGERDTAQQMATRMMANMEAKEMQVGEAVKDTNRGVDLITDIATSNDVLNVEQETVRVRVPCAVDSGSCVNVAPGGICFR